MFVFLHTALDCRNCRCQFNDRQVSNEDVIRQIHCDTPKNPTRYFLRSVQAYLIPAQQVQIS
jgi:hypothetical protein